MRYTASSVKRELETTSAFTLKGEIGCPQDSSWTPNGNTPCTGVPDTCDYAQEQTCKQVINVYDQVTGCKLSFLPFYFTISSKNLDGFIDANDQRLALVIRAAKKRNCPINTDEFVPC